MTAVNWDRVFADTPRRSYIPAVVWADDDDPINRDKDPDAWAEAVATDTPLVTQMDDGAEGGGLFPSSSASMPSLVRLMLDQLDIRPDHRVLEVGTGTGWNAALLATALTDGEVITIEVDPALAAQAKENLIACRAAPFVVVGDGLRGYPDGAPYDRLIATMAVQHVPYEWPEQVKPGGVILTPWGTAFHNSGLLRLVVNSDGTASGPFVGSVNFMWARSQRRRFDTREFVGDVIPDPAPDRVRHTTTDPRPVREEHAEFAIGLRLPDVEQRVYFGRGDAADEYTQWLSDGLSWASVDYVPGADKFEVNESGPRDLWAEIEAAYDAWRAQGEPAREQHGVTVTPDGQRTWVNGPNGRVDVGPASVA
ncbi:methyltransferase domain-containing protein [Embleya scabrispora]|uniref:methyltransferase domain-containing protein n=1 Tax=Embleya scabrispora TaxID=159449 RepID=UPI000380CD65|nr:methyltransferase domain-containing protein [Embleya scabrispora]MYS83599.1 methyltransferase domain-containing protein [Streptomyces sp. SID5474]